MGVQLIYLFQEGYLLRVQLVGVFQILRKRAVLLKGNDRQVLLKSKLIDLGKEESRLASRYAAQQDKAGSGVQEVKRLQEAYSI